MGVSFRSPFYGSCLVAAGFNVTPRRTASFPGLNRKKAHSKANVVFWTQARVCGHELRERSCGCCFTHTFGPPPKTLTERVETYALLAVG